MRQSWSRRPHRAAYPLRTREKLAHKFQWVRDMGVTEGDVYDQTTAAAVEEFQKRVGLPATGIADFATRGRLGAWPPPPPRRTDFSRYGRHRRPGLHVASCTGGRPRRVPHFSTQDRWVAYPSSTGSASSCRGRQRSEFEPDARLAVMPPRRRRRGTPSQQISDGTSPNCLSQNATQRYRPSLTVRALAG